MADELLKSQRLATLKDSIMKVTDEKLMWPEIKKRIDQGDIQYILALNMAKKKIEEMENRKTGKMATRYSSIYEATGLISHALIGIYLCLSFVQQPPWCRGVPPGPPENNTYYADCTGTVKEGHVIPLSNIPYLKNWQLVLIEVICVTLLTARRYLKQVVKKITSHTLFRVILGVTILVYASDILQYGFGVLFPINQFIRPLYFILYSKDVRSNFRFYGRIFWRSKEVFIAIAGIFLFFVCLAKVIFYQTSQNAPGTMNFDSFWNTMYNLFVGMTTSNYPDLMMPIYQEYRVSSIYFIIFMMVMYFVLLKIILAYFYYNYKEELIKEVQNFQRRGSKNLDSLFSATEKVPSRINSHSGSFLDTKGHTFYEEVGRLHQVEIRRLLEKSKWKKALLETLELPSLKFLFATGSLMSFIFLIIQSCVVSPQPQTSYTPEELEFNEKFNKYWMYIQLALNFFLLIDPVIRAISIGWKHFIELWFHLFDLSLSITIVFVIIMKLAIIEDLSMTMVRVIIIFRAFRFFKWVVSFEKYKLIYDTLVKLLPLFLDLLGVLTIAFYVYSTLGTVLFGGYLKTNIGINFSQFGDPNYFIYVNFNDFAQGLYTCFHLLVVNNWLYTVDVHCRTMGSFAYRTFFVSFYIIVEIICLNIMIAFILDLYVTQIATREKGSVRTFENDRIGYEDIDVDSNNNQYSMQGLTTKQENHWEILEERKTSFVGENKNRGNQYVQLSPAYKSKSEDGSESIPK